MSVYECTVCNYKTTDYSNFLKHNSTKKHKLKIQPVPSVPSVAPENISNAVQNIEKKKSFKCKYCKNSFTRASSLTKHKKTCSDNIASSQENKINNLTQVNDILQKELDQMKTDIKYYKHLINNAGNIVKTSISALSYVTKNYANAPTLEAIKDYSYLGYDENDSDFDLIETLIYEHNTNTLPNYLGDFIVAYYKKLDPQKQSIWNSDTSRLTYVIKEIINKKSDWAVDKKGIKTSKSIIDPLVEYIKQIVSDYLETTENIDEYIHESAHKMKLHLDKFKSAGEIMCDINNKVLQEQILRYIAPYFYLNKNDDCLAILQ